jgi:hypothetical protein
VAKHKGKRNKDRRSGSEPGDGATATARPVTAATPAAATQAGTPATAKPAATPAPERVGATVIQFPKAPSVPAVTAPVEAVEAPPAAAETPPNVSARTTLRAGSDPAVTAPSAPAAASASELSPPEGEGDRVTIPPVKQVEPEATSETSGIKTAILASIPPPEGAAAEAKATADKASAAAAKSAADKSAADKGARAKADVVVPKRDERRDRKESLSTHLSEEAMAFFSDASLEGAYKAKHDNFDDLKPIASPEYTKELQHSRRWMAITGAMLFGVVALVIGFSIAGRMGVSETALDTSSIRNIPEPTPPTPPVQESSPPPAEPPPAAAAPPAEPPPAAAAPPAEPPPAAAAPPAEPPPAAATPPAEPPPAAAAPPAEPPPAAAAPPVAAPPVAAPPVAAPPAPAAGDAASLLAAARAYRGPFAGRVAAWEAYFNAAPTQDRAMADRAFDWAEAHPADAERIASRAVAANPNNSKAWFVLAYTRGRLGNAAGRREAMSRCIALGGQYAAECRAL